MNDSIKWDRGDGKLGSLPYDFESIMPLVETDDETGRETLCAVYKGSNVPMLKLTERDCNAIITKCFDPQRCSGFDSGKCFWRGETDAAPAGCIRCRLTRVLELFHRRSPRNPNRKSPFLILIFASVMLGFPVLLANYYNEREMRQRAERAQKVPLKSPTLPQRPSKRRKMVDLGSYVDTYYYGVGELPESILNFCTISIGCRALWR